MEWRMFVRDIFHNALTKSIPLGEYQHRGTHLQGGKQIRDVVVSRMTSCVEGEEKMILSWF
jgi:hypothetical protein